MQHLLLAANPPPSVHGARALGKCMELLRQRLEALGPALQQHQQGGAAAARRCRQGPPSARTQVLGSLELLAKVLAFGRPREWLFVAPTSRLLRAAYVRNTEPTPAAAGALTLTDPNAAVESVARLDAAAAHGLAKALARLGRADYRLHGFCCYMGASGCSDTVQRARELCPRVRAESLLRGASNAGRGAAWLERLCREGLVNTRRVGMDAWVDTAFGLVAAGDEGPGLVWVSQQPRRRDREWPFGCANALCNRAANFAHLGTLQFLLDPQGGLGLFGPLQELTAADVVCPDAFETPLLEEVVYKSPGGERAAVSVMDAAARSGSVEVLQWLHERSHAFTPSNMECAARGGNFQALQWLERQGCAFDADALCQVTLEGGGVTVAQLQWIRERGGGDWSQQGITSMLAEVLSAGFYPSELVPWLREQGAAWPSNLHELARWYSLQMVAYALRQGCPWGQWTSEVCTRLLGGGCNGFVNPAADLLQLHDLGCPCTCPREWD